MKIRHLMLAIPIAIPIVVVALDAPRRARMRMLAAHHHGIETGCRLALANRVEIPRGPYQFSRNGRPLTRAEVDAYYHEEEAEKVRRTVTLRDYHARMRRKYERALYWSWLVGVDPDPPPPPPPGQPAPRPATRPARLSFLEEPPDAPGIISRAARTTAGNANGSRPSASSTGRWPWTRR